MHNKNMPKKVIYSLILSCLSLSAYAINLGSLNVTSNKNQPLKAELELGVLTEAEFRALKLEFIAPDNATDLKQYGIQSTIEKKGNKYYAKIITRQPLPESINDIKIKSNINGEVLEKNYSNLLKITNNDIIKATPVPNKIDKASAKSNQNKIIDSSSGQYIVKEGDNLYNISGSHSKNLQDVSLDQVIVAIYQSNQQAFHNGNMNRLRSGSALSLPTSEQASSIDQKSAKLEITARTTQYSKYRNKVINFVNKRAPESQASTSQKGSVSTESKQVQITDNATDNLKIQKSTATDKKEQNIAQQLVTQESKDIQAQQKKIEDTKKELDAKKEQLSSAVVTNNAVSGSDANNTSVKSSNIIEDEKHQDPLGLNANSSSVDANKNDVVSSTEQNEPNKTQGTISTSADIKEKTQLEVKKKNSSIIPFLVMLFGAGGIGYYIHKRRKKNDNEDYDSLFVHNSNQKPNNNTKNNSLENNAEFEDNLNSNSNFLTNALKSSSTSVNANNTIDNFNLGASEENFKQVNLETQNDDHLFLDNEIQLINDINTDKFSDKDKSELELNQNILNNTNIPSKEEVEKSTNDIDFDDIPMLSMDDQIDSLDVANTNTNTNTNIINNENETIEQVVSIQENNKQNNNNKNKDNAFYETKLELAKAYLDIEDFSGASMLLEELVAQTEDKKVQKQAIALLKEINNI